MKAVEGLSAPMLLFTEDEANELKRALKGFDSKKVNAFIQHLRHLCHALLLNFHDNVDITKYQRPSRTEHKDKANKFLRRIKKTRDDLQYIADGQFTPLYYNKIREIFRPLEEINNLESDPDFCFNRKAVDTACEAISKLNELIDIFESTVDAAKNTTVHQELASSIAVIYRKHLGKPTSGSNDAFPWVLDITFRAVQSPLKNIRSAEKLAAKILSNFPVK